MKIPIIKVQHLGENGFIYVGGDIAFGTVPCIIEGIVNKWDAFEKWKPKYLSSKYGDKRVECFRSDKNDRNFLQQVSEMETVSFHDFLFFTSGIDKGDKYLRYLRIGNEHPLFKPLSGYFQVPEFLENYNPDATGIWMGSWAT